MALKHLLKGVSLTGILLLISFVSAEDVIAEDEDLTFPPEFIFGAATSSYQIEGGWNASDKGENSWDFYTHTQPHRISDVNNGDVACDSFHKYAEDAQALQDLGMNFYRFSLSWSRILPNGYSNVVSKDGIAYYNKLLDELEKRNITPLMTLYHWDHPQIFQHMGGWTNEIMVDLYTDYAKLVFETFGDRVKHFITINEPNAICRYSYLYGLHAPGLKVGPHGEYLCNTNILKAHARAYRMYEKDFKPKHDGKVGITLELRNYFPKNKDDKESANIGFQFQFGIYAHPIYSKTGDWPKVVKERVDANSKKDGLRRSRLPELSPEWIKEIQGSADFLGLNHYTSMLVEPLPENEVITDDGLQTAQPKLDPSLRRDHGLRGSYDPKWPDTTFAWLKMVPEGFLNAFLTIKREYENPLVYVTENGVADGGTTEDNQRLEYLHGYMKNMLIAIHKHKCNVKGHAIWSLLDNFEWSEGYKMKFGLYQVDFNSPNRTRTAKNSSRWLKEVIKTKKLLPIDEYKVANAPTPPVCDDKPEHCGIGSIHKAPEVVDIYFHH